MGKPLLAANLVVKSRLPNSQAAEIGQPNTKLEKRRSALGLETGYSGIPKEDVELIEYPPDSDDFAQW